MCGICGIYNAGTGRAVDPGHLKMMTDILVHRGPDDEGCYVHGPVGLGFRRLAIIDVGGGRQPMANEDGSVWTVFNGEVYNFKPLRSELESFGHKFSSVSDTEVLVHGYEQWGAQMTRRLRGMFAFAIWDEKAGKLILARDRLGKKPLYYACVSGTLYFASELKAILQVPGLSFPVNQLGIDMYLTLGYIPSPFTIFHNVFQLPPAHIMEYRPAIMKIVRYWDVHFTPKIKITFNEAVERLRALLLEATRLRMVADVPLGAFLSGGLDSSAVVGMMALSSELPVKTFSIGFAEQDYSELEYARMTARRFSTDHHEFVVRPEMIDVLPRLVWHYDQPYSDSSALPSYYVARQTRQNVTVALNGDGSDESFAGYLRYAYIKFAGLVYGRVPGVGLSAIRILARSLPDAWLGRRLLRRLRLGLEYMENGPEAANFKAISIFTEENKKELYAPAFLAEIENIWDYSDPEGSPSKYIYKNYSNAESDQLLDRILYTDLHTYLPGDLLVKMDVATMANSLEARSPFLDHHLVEFAASLPSEWKLKGFKTKYLLKRAMKDFLPDEVVKRRKMGFGVPLEHWFRNELVDFTREILFSDKAGSRGYFKMDTVSKMFSDHKSGVRDNSLKLWNLLMLELWHRVFVDKDVKI